MHAEVVCASEPLTFDDHLKSIGDEKLVIDTLVGDLRRIIPGDVHDACQRLLNGGFDSRSLNA